MADWSSQMSQHAVASACCWPCCLLAACSKSCAWSASSPVQCSRSLSRWPHLALSRWVSVHPSHSIASLSEGRPRTTAFVSSLRRCLQSSAGLLWVAPGMMIGAERLCFAGLLDHVSGTSFTLCIHAETILMTYRCRWRWRRPLPSWACRSTGVPWGRGLASRARCS